MLPTTTTAIRALLQADTTLNPRERQLIAALAQNHGQTTPAEAQPPRIISRAEAGTLLHRSARAVDLLADAGLLRRIKLPGRTRHAGFLLSEVEGLIMSSVQQDGGAE